MNILHVFVMVAAMTTGAPDDVQVASKPFPTLEACKAGAVDANSQMAAKGAKHGTVVCVEVTMPFATDEDKAPAKDEEVVPKRAI